MPGTPTLNKTALVKVLKKSATDEVLIVSVLLTDNDESLKDFGDFAAFVAGSFGNPIAATEEAASEARKAGQTYHVSAGALTVDALGDLSGMVLTEIVSPINQTADVIVEVRLSHEEPTHVSIFAPEFEFKGTPADYIAQYDGDGDDTEGDE